MFGAPLRNLILDQPRYVGRLAQIACGYQMRRNYMVSVIGAAGGIGQPLSLLLMYNPRITKLMLHDLHNVKGLAADLSHICKRINVCSAQGKDQVEKAVAGADLVIITAGVPRKPGMTRDELFNINASIVADTVKAIAKVSGNALIAIVTNPINSLVPLAAEILKASNVYDPKRLFGVTTLDAVRAERFIGEHMNLDPKKVKIPVIGGHTPNTILPITSQCKPAITGSKECIASIVKRIKFAGDEVVQAKAGKGSATLSMAYAAHRFADALLKGRSCEEAPVECAYVQSNVTEASFFSTPLSFGPEGIKKNHGLPKLNAEDKKALAAALKEIKDSIEKGICFTKN